jgi:hypothetical protein
LRAVRAILISVRTLITAFGLLVAVGCSSADDIVVALSMGDRVQNLRAFSTSVSGSTVTVAGGIATSDPCYTFTSKAEARGGTIEATVTAQAATGVLCIGLYNQQDYTLTLSRVPAGNWTLKVLHRDGAGSPVTKYETTVTVR